MNGAHDLGGMHGMGAIEIENPEPVFHGEWEKRVLALVLASGALGKWNIDKSRYFREKMPGPEYLNTSYYEHWLFGLEGLLEDSGLVSADEIDARMILRTSPTLPLPEPIEPVKPEQVSAVLKKGGPANMNDDCEKRFKTGDRVRVINRNPVGHIRAPRYTRGRTGTVVMEHGAFVFPDRNAATSEKVACQLYNVRFEGRDLWGDDMDYDPVYVDLFDNYLEPPS